MDNLIEETILRINDEIEFIKNQADSYSSEINYIKDKAWKEGYLEGLETALRYLNKR